LGWIIIIIIFFIVLVAATEMQATVQLWLIN